MSEPRPDLLAALPELVAEKIRGVLPGLRTCKAMAGRFDLDALKAIGVAAPAVLVSVTRLVQAQTFAGPHPTYFVELAAFIVTKDALGLSRDAAAAGICHTLLRLLPDQCWGQIGVAPAENVAAVPLLTAASDKSAISLWAVSWRQPIALAGWSLAAPQPLSIYVGTDPLGAATGIEDYAPMGETE